MMRFPAVSASAHRVALSLAASLLTMRAVLALPAGYVEHTIPLDVPPVGLAFDSGGTLYALEGAEFGSNAATLRAFTRSGAPGASFPVVGDDPDNFFAGSMGYDPVTDRLLITDNTGDGRLYAVGKTGERDVIATGIAGIGGVAVRDTGEIFVSTAPFGMPGEVRLVDRSTGASTAVVTGLGFGGGLAFDAAGDLLIQDAATASPYLGRLQRLPIEQSAGGLIFGTPAPLVDAMKSAAGVAIDSEGDVFTTGNGGLYLLAGVPLAESSFSANDNPNQFATAIAFQAGSAPFEPFAGPAGGWLAYMADFGFSLEDDFITLVTPATAGDFDSDGQVNNVDLGIWSENFGTAPADGRDGDADRDGDVDGADFLHWQRRYTPAPALLATAVPAPEPAAFLTFLSANLLFTWHARTKRYRRA